jgi:hypothetical protein
MNSPILANIGIFARTVPKALLANKNLTSAYSLASEALHATSFGYTISAV